MDAGRRHRTPGFGTKDFINQGTMGSSCSKSGLAPRAWQGLWCGWLCKGSACLGWTMSFRIFFPLCFWLGWESCRVQGSGSYFVFHARRSWSTDSPCWFEAFRYNRSSGSSLSFWLLGRFVCSRLWWRALVASGYTCHQGKKQLFPDRWLSNYIAN